MWNNANFDEKMTINLVILIIVIRIALSFKKETTRINIFFF